MSSWPDNHTRASDDDLGFRRAVSLLDAYSGATLLDDAETDVLTQSIDTVALLQQILEDPDRDGVGHVILGLLSLGYRLLTDLEQAAGKSRIELFLDLIDPDVIRCCTQ